MQKKYHMREYNERREREKAHFTNRCKQRLGVSFPIHTIRGMVRRGELPLLHHESRTRTLYLFTYIDKKYVLVYDSGRCTPVTIYPYIEDDWQDCRKYW